MDARRRLLLETWAKTVALLDSEMVGVRALLPLPEGARRGAALKAFEDMLGALVCVWIGVTVLEGRSAPHWGRGQFDLDTRCATYKTRHLQAYKWRRGSHLRL
jgi:hypothetical protein